jgi:hypothetical protein
LKLQVSVRWRASTAVHVTRVVPIGKKAPLAGAHETATAGAPPMEVGVPYWTVAPWTFATMIGGGAAGQVIVGPFG